MFNPGWSIWCLLLTLHTSVCDLSGYDGHDVVCSQGLSNCTMEDESLLNVEENKSVEVKNLTPYFKLRCEEARPCRLCMVIETEVNIHVNKNLEDEDHSGTNDEEYEEEINNVKASVLVCYKTPQTFPTCKRAEFTVNHAAVTQQHQAKVTMVITEPTGVTFNSEVIIYSVKPPLMKNVEAPSIDKVCSHELHERIEECQVPKLHSVVKKEDQVELQFVGRNKDLPSVCVQYEKDGRCQRLEGLTIPLYSVAHCMCFQVWEENSESPLRSQNCPFTNTDSSHRTTWENVSVSVGQGQMRNSCSMLLWNVSAPCKLEGEVWPCRRDTSCKELKGYRQQLEKGTWEQSSKGQWVQIGVFENISLQLSPCVMMKVKGMSSNLGPFCFNNTDRWRWSLLVIGVMLTICLTAIMFYLLHGSIKKWVWSWRHGRFVKVRKLCHVVLLSPPDADAGVSESVRQLGCLLFNHGFSVSVDQWSRMEQCSLGPQPWLHSQLLELKSHGGRFLLILTQEALDRAEEWTHWNKTDTKTKVDSEGLPQMFSPYSDVFSASLCIIQAEKQQGRAGERFLLVSFDSKLGKDQKLPEILQGLSLFHLPSKTGALLSELTVGGTEWGMGR